MTANKSTPINETQLGHELFGFVLKVLDQHQPQDRYVIAIAGESGSGKSTTANLLADMMNETDDKAIVLSMDHYFKAPPRTNHYLREEDISRVGPQEVALDNLLTDVVTFLDGADELVVPVTDYVNDRFEKQTLALSGVKFLIVEGTYTFMLDCPAIRIFINRTYQQTYAQRIARNRDIMTPFVERVLAIEHELIQKTASLARIEINTDYQPILKPA